MEKFTTLTAIAPTTSSSFIIGQVSPSIEPLKDNYFTSLMLAVGLDYNISDKLKINLEPNLTRFVSTGGIGPNDDKINTLGLKMGVKYIL